MIKSIKNNSHNIKTEDEGINNNSKKIQKVGRKTNIKRKSSKSKNNDIRDSPSPKNSPLLFIQNEACTDGKIMVTKKKIKKKCFNFTSE